MYLFYIINHPTAKTHATVMSIVQIYQLHELMLQKARNVQALKTRVKQLSNSYYPHQREQGDAEVLTLCGVYLYARTASLCHICSKRRRNGLM
jgi:hypothetical protein